MASAPAGPAGGGTSGAGGSGRGPANPAGQSGSGGQGGAQPGSGQPTPSKPGTPPAGQPQARAVPLKARPIPPSVDTKKQPIKGVRSEATLDEATAKRQGLEQESVLERAKRGAPKPPTEQPAGQEPRAEGAVQQQQDTVDALAEGQDAGKEIPLATYERLLGKKFKNVAEAEHHVRSLRSQAGRTEAASRREAQYKEAVEGYEALNRQLQARLQQYEGGQSPKNPQPGQDPNQQQQQGQDPGAEAAQSFVDSITPEGWQYVKKIFEKEGPEVAIAWTLHRFEKTLSSRFANIEQQILSQIQPHLEPIVQEHQQRQQTVKAENIWKEFAGYTYDDGGDPMFPELAEAMKADPTAVREIALAWLELGRAFGRDVAFSEWGVHAAYRDWRDYRAQRQARGASSAAAATRVAARIEQDAQRAASTASPAASVPPAPGPVGDAANDEASLRKAIRNANVGGRKTQNGFALGFRE